MGKLFGNNASVLAETYPLYLVETSAQITTGSDSVDTTNMAAQNQNTYPFNVKSYMYEMVDSNPYAGAYDYDPEEHLTNIAGDLETFEAYIDDLNTTDDFEKFLVKASTLFESYGISASSVESEVDISAAATEEEYYRGIARFIGGMVDINQVHGTPVIMGMAVRDTWRGQQLNQFRLKLLGAAQRDKNVFLIQAAQLMMGMDQNLTTAKQYTYTENVQLEKIMMTARRDKMHQDLEYDVGEIEWPMEVLKSAQSANQLNATSVPKKPSQINSGIAAALSAGPSIGIGVGNALGSPAAGLAAGLAGTALAFIGGFTS